MESSIATLRCSHSACRPQTFACALQMQSHLPRAPPTWLRRALSHFALRPVVGRDTPCYRLHRVALGGEGRSGRYSHETACFSVDPFAFHVDDCTNTRVTRFVERGNRCESTVPGQHR